jgi:4-hydroxybenzoate polyprenyltransferase
LERMATLAAFVRAMRLPKVLPLVVVLVDAALLTRASVDVVSCALGCAFVLVVSVAGTQINILTDASLDRERKPQLFEALTRSESLLRASLWIEAGTCALLAWAIRERSGRLLVAVVVYGAAFILYSYNFVAFWAPARNRLKVRWWGHAASVMAGYAALWVAGFACQVAGRGLEPREIATIAVGGSLVDYGVFLNESSVDAEEERAHGLRTLPALLGRGRASAVALAIMALGVVALSSGAEALVRAGLPLSALALAWYGAIQALGCIGSLLYARRSLRSPHGDVLVDSAFWLSRVGMMAILLWR